MGHYQAIRVKQKRIHNHDTSIEYCNIVGFQFVLARPVQDTSEPLILFDHVSDGGHCQSLCQNVYGLQCSRGTEHVLHIMTQYSVWHKSLVT